MVKEEQTTGGLRRPAHRDECRGRAGLARPEASTPDTMKHQTPKAALTGRPFSAIKAA
jgi:hypothetical protein